MRCLKVLILSLLSFVSLAQGIEYKNKVYKENIHSVKMELANWEISYPVLELNGDNQLLLSFDDFSSEVKDYSYKIIHCNADWTPSDLAENEYLDGFFENLIESPRSSFNTFQSYYHYKVFLPNKDVQIKKSGNYILKIYEDYDENHLILTHRFSVYENLVSITAKVQRAMLSRVHSSHQQVDFRVFTQGITINDPYSDIKISVVQNNNWQQAKTDLSPQFVNNNELVFEDPNENIYPAYNEFRCFSIKSLKYMQERVAKIFFEDKTYFVRLMDDEDRRFKVYINDADINGAYIVRNREFEDYEVEADYARVYFYLPRPEPVTEGDIYVYGELSNWEISERYKMRYNYEKHAYEMMLELKQGYYNYRYVYANPEKQIFDPSRIEGSHHETENDYLIYVYARMFGDTYDRLVGFLNINSIQDLKDIFNE